MFKKIINKFFSSKINVFKIEEQIKSIEIREQNLENAYKDIKKYKETLEQNLENAYKDIKKYKKSLEFMPSEFSKEEKKIIEYVLKNNLSMTQNVCLYNTIKYCKYIIDHKIKGDFVECGVWRGGHAILAAKIFELYGAKKKVYLFDTFKGMTSPIGVDKRLTDKESAKDLLSYDQDAYCYASIDEVKSNFSKIKLLKKNVIFIQGDVAETLKIKNNLPKKIGYLRLDTDWYESSKIELEILYPRLSKKGVLVLDDYGYWKGQKKATDEFFKKMKKPPPPTPIVAVFIKRLKNFYKRLEMNQFKTLIQDLREIINKKIVLEQLIKQQLILKYRQTLLYYFRFLLNTFLSLLGISYFSKK